MRLAQQWLSSAPTPLLALNDAALIYPPHTILWHMHQQLWPEMQAYQAAIMPWPGDAAYGRAMVQILGSASAGGHVRIYGRNDLGIKSALKKLADIYSAIDIEIGDHGRIYHGQYIGAKITSIEQLALSVEIGQRRWLSLPGLFAQGRLDEASALLLQSLPPLQGRVLDYGCGIGILGGMALGDYDLTLLDINSWALWCAQRNLPQAVAVQASRLMGQSFMPFDTIISNPPWHIEGKVSTSIIEQLLADAPSFLNAAGQMWLVLPKTMPLAKMAHGYWHAQEQAANKAFSVWCLTAAH